MTQTVQGRPVRASMICQIGNFDGDATAGPNDLNVDPELDDEDIHLLNSSPRINAGDTNVERLDGETDIDGAERVFNGQVDIGADKGGDCNENGVPDDLDILQGTSQDCNANDIPDECDALGLSNSPPIGVYRCQP